MSLTPRRSASARNASCFQFGGSFSQRCKPSGSAVRYSLGRICFAAAWRDLGLRPLSLVEPVGGALFDPSAGDLGHQWRRHPARHVDCRAKRMCVRFRRLHITNAQSWRHALGNAGDVDRAFRCKAGRSTGAADAGDTRRRHPRSPASRVFAQPRRSLLSGHRPWSPSTACAGSAYSRASLQPLMRMRRPVPPDRARPRRPSPARS